MEQMTWYANLVKPAWAPPAWVFGPVWTVLYILITISFGYVMFAYFGKRISFIVLLPFLLNLVFNFAFSPIQFGLQNNVWAAIDIVCVLGTLIWALATIYPTLAWVTFINIPYLLWVSFATALQLTITWLNR